MEDSVSKLPFKTKANRPLVVFAGRILLIDLSIFAGVGAICWLIGARTPQHYSLGLVLAGAVCILIGLTTVLGGGGVSMSLRDTDLPASKEPKATIHRRVDCWLTGPVGSLGFLLMMSVAGLVLLIAGWLIRSAFRG